jgi:type IV pilus modification protein PilV
MKEHGIPTSQAGFSLLEVLIALSILAVGLLGLAVFQITAIQGNASASDTVAATYYGQEKMETLQLVPFGNLDNSAFGISGGLPDNTAIQSITDSDQVTVSKKGQRYYRVWAVSNVTPTLKMIRIWVYWWDQRGRSHTVQLVTQRGNVSWS